MRLMMQGLMCVWVFGVCGVLSSNAGAVELLETEEPLNVILISLDTVRPDHLSSYGYHRRTTPHIDRIASEGIVFTRAFAQAPDTLPSHLSLFTSRYPRRPWVFWETAELAPSTVTLTEWLAQHGYQTAAFTDLGETLFDPLRDSRAFQAFQHQVTGVRLRALPQELFDWLQAHRSEPFFLFVHGFDAHEPHVLPIQYDAKRFNPTYQGRLASTRFDLQRESSWSAEQLREFRKAHRYVFIEAHLEQLRADDLPDPDDLEHLLALYDAQLYYLDQGLGQLFQALENLDLMDRTVIVIVSDHGQAFGEHGAYATHGHGYDEVTRMVLIIRDPRLEPARRGKVVPQLVQAIDVMPTILERVGLPLPASIQGRSLAALLETGEDPSREEVAVTVGKGMRVLRTPAWKLLSYTDGRQELYDMIKDPMEQQNRLADYPKIVAELTRRLDAAVSLEEAGEFVDPEQWMREQGYW